MARNRSGVPHIERIAGAAYENASLASSFAKASSWALTMAFAACASALETGSARAGALAAKATASVRQQAASRRARATPGNRTAESSGRAAGISTRGTGRAADHFAPVLVAPAATAGPARRGVERGRLRSTRGYTAIDVYVNRRGAVTSVAETWWRRIPARASRTSST